MAQRLKSAYIPYTLAHRRFFDVLGSPDADDPSPSLAPGEAPPGWRRHEVGAWTAFSPGGGLPAAGWKVHVAALPGDAREVVATSLRACFSLGVTVKVLRTERTVWATQLKYANPEGSGKVVVAYPASPTDGAALLERLVADLGGLAAPGIVGEVPVVGAPVWLRHGAFLARWVTDDEGRSRPGTTRPDGSVASDLRGARGVSGRPPLPEELVGFVARGAPASLDVDDVVVLHRSNGGGVYRARWRGGPTVVLKEARHHAGLDLAAVDAVTRLRHEHAVLCRLAGTGLAPEVVDMVTVGSSDFLVMEHVEGRPLTAQLVARHPGSVGTAPDQDGLGYAAWVEQTSRALRHVAEELHRRGVVHGDLHPGNVLETVHGLVAVDLESAALDGHAVATGVTALGAPVDAAPSPADDLAAVERTRLTLMSPHTGVLAWRPELAAELERAGRADIAGLPSPGGPPPSSRALAAGLLASASPGRTDRLFPGDPVQFTSPGAGWGLLNGAAGVALALDAVGVGLAPAWLELIAARAAAGPVSGGLAHGLEGVALALTLLGRPDLGEDLARRAREVPDDTPYGPGWAHGHAGRALVLAELTQRLGTSYAAAAEHHLGATLAAVDDERAVMPGCGLLGGWSGVALALLGVADLAEPDTARRCRAAAHRALVRETSRVRVVGGAVLLADGGRLLPHLATGAAALGLAGQALLERSAEPGGELSASQRGRLEELVAGVRETCRRPVVVGAGLMHGRAGMLAAQRRLACDQDPAVALHAHRLGWHVVALPDGGSTMLLGDTDLRLSGDLATGSAGGLVALAPRARDALHAVLRLPRDRGAATLPMTAACRTRDTRQTAPVTAPTTTLTSC